MFRGYLATEVERVGQKLSKTAQVIYLTYCVHIQSHPHACHAKNVFVLCLPSSMTTCRNRATYSFLRHLIDDRLRVKLTDESFLYQKEKHRTEDRPVLLRYRQCAEL